MLFWNKVEIYCGFSLKDFSELRDVLALKGVKNDYRLVNYNCRRSGHPANRINNDRSIQYYLYVHKKDYDQAMYLTSNRKR